MQQKRDDLDKVLFTLVDDIDVKNGYNNRLINKLKNKNRNIGFEYRTAAVSLILSGILIMTIYTTNMQYTLTKAKYQAKSQAFMIMTNLNANRFFLGE